MGSRKEEERNEKIIRGLMKLPPNRKCINCNSLGPQYVCTNFWTFVCMTCSGIHREFTHRVKSVSMATFTSQEVEALQNGGNQRAREIYLKDWDTQRQRFPDISNVDRVREFIKNVYIDRKYAGGKSSDKPPRDGQSLRSPDEETRRASSYHSYSQSPPYDHQYEDRRYGKQSAVLTRKPGSDRGFDGKLSRWFSNDGSGSRVSEHSVSSGGTQSPNNQGSGFGSPPLHRSRNMSSEDVLPRSSFSDANIKRVPDGIPRPQRTASLGSLGSFDNNSPTLNTFNSGNLVDGVSESEQSLGPFQEKQSSFSQPSIPGGPNNVDLFKAPVSQETFSFGPSSIDLFQQPTNTLTQVDFFQSYNAPPLNMSQPPQSSQPSSLDFFALQQPADSAATVNNTLPTELSVPKNDGWATFDTHPAAFPSGTENLTTVKVASEVEGSFGQFDPFSSFDTGKEWASFQLSGAHESSSTSDPWNDGLNSVRAPAAATYTESWNAFEDSNGYLPSEVVKESNEQAVGLNSSSATDTFMNDLDKDYIHGVAPYDQYLNNIGKNATERPFQYGGADISITQSHAAGPSYAPEGFQGETPSHAADHKSTNPFDIPYDLELEQSNMFLDMSSLQATLPNAQLPPTFLDVTESWFPENPVTTYTPAVPQVGGLAYIAAQAPNSPIKNVPAQGPVASVGGNPFA